MGLPKTGTTTVQNAFWRVRDRLLDGEGLLYPPPEPNHTNAVCTMFLDDPSRHITNRMRAREGAVDLVALQADYRAKMEEGLTQSGWSHVLISAEGLSNLAAHEIEKLRVWMSDHVDEMEVLFWVREPVAYVTSVSQELLKAGRTLASLRTAPPLPNFRGKISNAIEVFGRSSVKIRAFEEAVADPDGPTAAFARDIGLSEAGVSTVAAAAAGRDNAALSDEAARMLDYLNELRPVFGPQSERRSGREVQHLQTVQGNRFSLARETEEEIHAATRDDVAWLNETFGTSLYRDAPGGSVDDARDMRPETLKTTAILLSNLINTSTGLTLALQAAAAHRDGNDTDARRLMDRARTLTGGASKLIEHEARRMGLAD